MRETNTIITLAPGHVNRLPDHKAPSKKVIGLHSAVSPQGQRSTWTRHEVGGKICLPSHKLDAFLFRGGN